MGAWAYLLRIRYSRLVHDQVISAHHDIHGTGEYLPSAFLYNTIYRALVLICEWCS